MSSGPVASSHDWSTAVDEVHLALIRRSLAAFAPDGAVHLLAEVLAYADDEASVTGSRRCVVTLTPGGAASITDFGRGTDTRRLSGHAVKKPVMSTKDLRFFDAEPPTLLPTGRPRRGMSVVAAASRRLVHVNRRIDGSWRQEYEFGIPVTDLCPVDGDGTTGTTVEFLPDDDLPGLPDDTAALVPLLHAWPQLDIELVDLRRD